MNEAYDYTNNEVQLMYVCIFQFYLLWLTFSFLRRIRVVIEFKRSIDKKVHLYNLQLDKYKKICAFLSLLMMIDAS